MRRAIEKLTFLLLSFAAASVVSFALLALLCDRAGPTSLRPLPLLVNLSPRDARDLTLAAVRTVAANGAGAERARAELARLGGAALPHVLPALESLEPAARGRVASALVPVARRMGVAGDDELDTPERAVVFFTRFWQDRGADFRTQAVRRKVTRLAERALPLRRKEVVELDTFALGELLDALGRVKNGEDVKRVERLAPVLAHVTGVALTLPPNPSVTATQTLVTRWREWAFEHAPDFASLDGPGRLAAIVLQTRYFGFLASMARTVQRDDPAGVARLHDVLAAARTTLPLVLAALALGAGLSLAFTRWAEARATRHRPLLLAATGLAAAPLTGVAVQGAALGSVALVILLGTGLSALLVLELDGSRPGPSRLVRLGARVGLLLPLVLAAELGAEAAGYRGLGRLAREALAAGDLDTAMWIAAVLSAASCLGVLAPDTSRRPPDDDVEPHSLELMPGARGRAAVVAVGALIGLFATLGALQRHLPGTLGAFGAAAGRTLVVTLVASGAAATVGIVLGLLAGGVSRAVDVLLGRLGELSLALPQPLVAGAAFVLAGPLAPALLGALHGLEIALVLRARLTEQRAYEDIEAPHLGRSPLSPYFRRVLPAAIAPVATAVVLSGAWIAAFEGTCAALGVMHTPSLGTLAASAGGPGFVALLLLAAFVGALCWLVQDVTPHARPVAASGPVVLALKRRIDSVRPPSGPGDGSGPAVEP